MTEESIVPTDSQIISIATPNYFLSVFPDFESEHPPKLGRTKIVIELIADGLKARGYTFNKEKYEWIPPVKPGESNG